MSDMLKYTEIFDQVSKQMLSTYDIKINENYKDLINAMEYNID